MHFFKQISATFLLIFIASAIAFAQCTEASSKNIGKKIVETSFNIQKNEDAVIGLSFTATSVDSDWKDRGSEAVAVTIFVNGKYSQDIFLFMGEQKFNYRVLLGGTFSGKNKVEIFKNTLLSAKKSGDVIVGEISAKAIKTNSSEELAALKNAPVIYLRPDAITKFSDIPLLVYYEPQFQDPKNGKIIYTAIFSNEDGGTRTAALMARWGRLTDIEWVYETEIKDLKPQNATFQGADHVTTDFNGSYILGDHPVFYDVTENNNFADKGCSTMRTLLWPVKADLTKNSREAIMDDNPFIYSVMNKEAIRENRFEPTNMGENKIDIFSKYLYVETYSENINAATAIEIETIDGKKSISDHGNVKLAAERSGYKRIAVHIPSNKSVKSVSVVCRQLQNKPAGECKNNKITKLITIDELTGYPRINMVDSGTKDLKPDTKLTFVTK